MSAHLAYAAPTPGWGQPNTLLIRQGAAGDAITVMIDGGGVASLSMDVPHAIVDEALALEAGKEAVGTTHAAPLANGGSMVFEAVVSRAMAGFTLRILDAEGAVFTERTVEMPSDLLPGWHAQFCAEFTEEEVPAVANTETASDGDSNESSANPEPLLGKPHAAVEVEMPPSNAPITRTKTKGVSRGR